MLILQNIAYIHPNKDLLFSNISLTVNPYQKIALLGNNGTGKSTLLKIMANELQPSGGQYRAEVQPYYIPQIFGQYNHLTVAQALKIDRKIHALNQILKGNATEENYTTLNDDWTIEERCTNALQYWQLEGLDMLQTLETLSGGQRTKVFLAGIALHQPELVLLDEPSNHLDIPGRQLLYDLIQSSKCTWVIVSHDRKLLNQLDAVCELSKSGIQVYGGNYDFYREQKNLESNALSRDIQSKEKAWRKAREKERETRERRQKLDSRGKGKQEKAGIARISMNTLRNQAETSTSKLKTVHAEKMDRIAQELHDLRTGVPDLSQMKIGLDNPALHNGKRMFKATQINMAFNGQRLWKTNLNVEMVRGERMALKGANGSGKTTLIKLILGELEPQTGTLYRSAGKSVYIDQDYALLDNPGSVYEQVQQCNTTALQEHEIKIRLNRFLFAGEDWDKPCRVLSGGERMRLLLCCLTVSNQAPDLIVLDEPTNNLDIRNAEILTTALNTYQGSLIVVSHDETFLEHIQIDRTLEL